MLKRQVLRSHPRMPESDCPREGLKSSVCVSELGCVLESPRELNKVWCPASPQTLMQPVWAGARVLRSSPGDAAVRLGLWVTLSAGLLNPHVCSSCCENLWNKVFYGLIVPSPPQLICWSPKWFLSWILMGNMHWRIVFSDGLMSVGTSRCELDVGFRSAPLLELQELFDWSLDPEIISTALLALLNVTNAIPKLRWPGVECGWTVEEGCSQWGGEFFHWCYLELQVHGGNRK